MRFVFVTIFSLLSIILHAQNQDNVDSLLNELLFSDEELLSILENKKSYHFLYSSINFRDQTYFAGRDIGIDQFSSTAQVSYLHSSGFSAGIAGIYYSEFEPRLNTTVLSLGYGKSFNNFRLRASFDKYFFADIDSLEDNSFNSSMTLGASYRLKHLRTSFNFSFLIGSDPSTQATWDLTGYINLWKNGYQKKLRLEPRISLLLGSESVLTTTSQPIGRGFLATTIETDTIIEKYGLLNTRLSLPLSFTYKNFDFEVGYNFNIPHSLDSSAGPLNNTSYFNFSVGYFN